MTLTPTQQELVKELSAIPATDVIEATTYRDGHVGLFIYYNFHATSWAAYDAALRAAEERAFSRCPGRVSRHYFTSWKVDEHRPAGNVVVFDRRQQPKPSRRVILE